MRLLSGEMLLQKVSMFFAKDSYRSEIHVGLKSIMLFSTYLSQIIPSIITGGGGWTKKMRSPALTNLSFIALQSIKDFKHVCVIERGSLLSYSDSVEEPSLCWISSSASSGGGLALLSASVPDTLCGGFRSLSVEEECNLRIHCNN